MQLKSARTLTEQRDVLMNQDAKGLDTVYWVISDINNEQWANLTIVSAGKFLGEYSKTYGHYHTTSNTPETYTVVQGTGVFQLQKCKEVNGRRVANQIEEVLLIGCKPGDKVKVLSQYGHSWSNIGEDALITLDSWRDGHSPDDYEPIKNLHGLAYYLVEENGKLRIVKNKHYLAVPEPKWLTAKEYEDYLAKLSS